jgi:hypothetical protein
MMLKAMECSKGGRVIRHSVVYDLEHCALCQYHSEGYCYADIDAYSKVSFKKIPDLPVVLGGHIAYTSEEMRQIDASMEKARVG